MKLLYYIYTLLFTRTLVTALATNPRSDKGDGLYVLTLDKSGNSVVNFTSLHDLGLGQRNKAKRSGPLAKRSRTTCKNNSNNIIASDIVGGYDCLEIFHAAHTNMAYHEWVWCFHGNAVVYECNYQANHVVWGDVINFKTVTDQSCSTTGLGYTRVTNEAGFNDLAMGRDNKGSQFCAPGVNGM